jgi:DNA-binding beta-propeller fold protein YncE
MKKFYQLLLLGSLLLTVACKKNEPQPLANDTQLALASTADTRPLPLSVITIAGQYNTQGNKDGTGLAAMFNYPHGIDIADDGTLYVADLFNNAVRKVSPTGVVTTLNLPAAKDGQKLLYPEQVLISNDGTITTLANYDLTPVQQHKFWILKPSGELITPASQVNYYTYRYYSIAKDPFSNYLQISGERFVTTAVNHRQGFIESAEIANGIIGKHPYTPPLDSLNTASREYSAITQMFCGYNGVKYIVVRGKYVYKLTQSGVFTRIFRDINFHEIRDLVANKDSRTIYMIDQGSIISITNNKLTHLVGPASVSTISHPDGVGDKAYVFADYMVLSKDENTIFFTDNNTVRKLILK